MTKIVAKYKYQIAIVTIILGLILGILLGTWINNYVAEKRIENYYFIHGILAFILSIIGVVIWFLPAIILFLLVYKFIIIPTENKLIQLQREAYELFIKSLETIKGNKVHGENVDSKIFFEFIHDKYRVVVSKHFDEDIIRLDWYDNETGKWINKKYIDFKAEPTIQDALTGGPWAKGIFPHSSGPIKLDDY
jgi:hypothetical protein